MQAQDEMRTMEQQFQKQEEELAAREEEAVANMQDVKHYAAESQEFQVGSSAFLDAYACEEPCLKSLDARVANG